LKDRGFTFWSFRKYWNSDKSKLPAKLIVFRHDVHSDDVGSAYHMHQVEEDLLGQDVSTYFVMLDMPPENLKGDYPLLEKNYLDLIKTLTEGNVEVQPHISPVDMYQYAMNPSWETAPAGVLLAAFKKNYSIVTDAAGETIVVTGKDVFGLANINQHLPSLLKSYNESWYSKTGLTVNSYAAHGTSTPMNQALNNEDILNQHVLLDSNIYLYDVYNTVIYRELGYFSDNNLPSWMNNPSLIPDGRHQILCHPRFWK
jgi:hypothetical protein